jgi:hyperosmotically inducible protein
MTAAPPSGCRPMGFAMLVFALVLAAAACTRPAPQEGDARSSAGASAPPAASAADAAMTAKVRAALVTDVGLKTLEVGVESNAGVVTLSGQVDTLDTKQRAQRAAESVRGVTWVQNRLSISPRSG